MSKNIHFNRIDNGKLVLSAEFLSTFPTLAALLNCASVIDFTLNNNQRFRQYIWAIAGNNTCGWLCQLEHVIPQDKLFLPEHILLVKNMGGVIHKWGDVDETLLSAKNFMFVLQDSFNGLDDEDNYLQNCKTEGYAPIDMSNLITFAMDANGDCTFYNKNTKAVFLYAHDGYSDLDITLVEGQPEYSIYTYTNIKTFSDYVELLAKQMQQIIAI